MSYGRFFVVKVHIVVGLFLYKIPYSTFDSDEFEEFEEFEDFEDFEES